MGTHALREGFREVVRDPALLLMEIAWRWSFGIIAVLVCSASIFLVLGSISFDAKRLEWLASVNPWQAAQVVAGTFGVMARQLFRVGITATLVLASGWACLSALGRHATLIRPAFQHKATLRSCLAISAARATLTVGAIAAWLATAFIAGVIAAATSPDALPNPLLTMAIVLPVIVLLASAWAMINWYLSLAPLFSESDWQSCIARVWSFVRLQRDRLFEISLVSAVMRAVLFVIALLLSLAVAAVVTNLKVLLADLIAISLLYFLVADFIYIARLAACAKLVRETVPAASAMDPGKAHPGSHSERHSDLEENASVSPRSILDQT